MTRDAEVAYNYAVAELNPIRYRGYYRDAETGWYFCQTRYYCPQWRRWISADVLFIAGNDVLNATNLYAYCNGNPVLYCDPSGTDAILMLDLKLMFIFGHMGLMVEVPCEDDPENSVWHYFSFGDSGAMTIEVSQDIIDMWKGGLLSNSDFFNALNGRINDAIDDGEIDRSKGGNYMLGIYIDGNYSKSYEQAMIWVNMGKEKFKEDCFRIIGKNCAYHCLKALVASGDKNAQIFAPFSVPTFSFVRYVAKHYLIFWRKQPGA